MLRSIFAKLTLFAVVFVMGCGAPAPDTFEEPEEIGSAASALTTVLSISVSPASASMPAGLTQLFKAAGLYTDGKTRTFTSGIAWSSSDPAIASIAADGTALTKAPGVATITALHGASGQSASATLTVTGETLVSIAVTPGSKSAGNAATVAYVATAKFSAGTTASLKGSIVAWSSSNFALAPIDAAGKVITGNGTGLSSIVARHVPTNTVSPAAELFVSDSPLTSISISPAAVTMPKDTSRAFVATGVLANGMTSDLTAAATWSSTKTTVATVPPGPGSSALVSAVGVGAASIRAKFGTITGSSTVTVPAAVLTSLAITPPNPRVSLGTNPQLVATGTYDDLTTVDRTESVTWTSSATSILKVSATAGSRGKLTPVKVGTATITAKDAKTGVTTSTVVTVTNVTLVSLSITPGSADAPLGTTVPFRATGSYSDASTNDLTSSVTWSSTNGNATISNADPTRGVATARAIGNTSITAQLGAVSAAANLNVTPARLARLEMVSASVSVIKDLRQQLDVIGVYTDAARVNLNTAVGWTSSASAIASVSNVPGTQGQVTAIAVGDTIVTATEPASGFTATTTVAVTAPTLLQINLIEPPTYHRPSLPRGFSDKPRALGIYSNGRAVAINELCTWETSDPGVMAVSNVAGERGKLTGLEEGASTITVTEPTSGVTTSVDYSTGPAIVVTLTIVPGPSEITVGRFLTFTTRANYTDGTVGAPEVRWQVHGDATVATTDGDFGATVGVTGLRPGQVLLSASAGPTVGTQAAITVVAAPEIQLVAGASHVCTLTSNADVKCWGSNFFGQLGVGDASDHSAPTVSVALGSGTIPERISSGLFHTCALLRGGSVKCWGDNRYGQLGLGDTNPRGSSANDMGDVLPAIALGAEAKAVAAGSIHTCALLVDGRVKCWGYNNGRLGLGDAANRGDDPNEMGEQLPAIDLGTGRTAKEIFSGGYVSCAFLDDDTTKCWGENYYGGGIGFVPNLDPSRYFIGDVPGEMGDALPTVTFGATRPTNLSLFYESGCVLLADSTAKCFGNNGEGALGVGDRQNWKVTDNHPPIDFGAGRSAKAIGTGFHNACAILDNDGVKCWGQGAAGPLGYGDTQNRGDGPGEMGDALPFVDLGAGRTAKRLAIGSNFSCAVLDNDRIKCWGSNSAGQLGIGDMTDRGVSPGQMGDALPYVNLVAACVAPPRGLLSSWRGDGDATDSRHLRDGGGAPFASFVPGKVGSAFLFDGASYIAASSFDLPLGASDRTLEAWVRLDAVTPNGEAFFAGYGGFGQGGGSFALGASGANVFFSQWGDAVFGGPLTLGSWTHLAVTSTGSVVALYVNGTKVSESSFFVNTQQGDFSIGALSGDPNRRLTGAVDEVAIYDRALTAEEVYAIYAAGSAGKCH